LTHKLEKEVISVKKIGPYLIEDGPFEGGFGEVYRVFETDSGDEFALKTLKDSFLSSADRLQRFRREIEAWINIPTHPNVVRAIRAFDHGGRPYVLIEWISGGNLQACMKSLLPREQAVAALVGGAEAIEVMCQICEGMDHIHRLGLVHGDLKPSNVMMWTGKSPQITDFGFARAAIEDARGMIGGTHRYMAPELQTGISNISSDIYAAGMTFLDMLELFQEKHFGVLEARGIALSMCSESPADRPESFAKVEARLKAVIEKAKLPPFIATRAGDRLTWDEKHASVIPERIQLDKARSLLAAGLRDKARIKLEEIVRQKPERADARILLANTLIGDGEAELAAEQLLCVRQADHVTPEQLINIAYLYVSIDRPDDARQAIADLSSNDELASRLCHLRGDIAAKEGNLTNAIDLYRRAIDSGADSRARYSLALALKDAGLVDEAITELLTIGNDDPDYGIKVTLMLARIYVDTERHNEAVTTLRQSLQKDLGREGEAYVYSKLGSVYKAQELFDAAVQSYRKALAILPADRAAREGLNEALEASSGHRTNARNTSLSAPPVQHSKGPIDARTAYEILTTLEHRFENDRFEDIADGIDGVPWPFLTNEFVIPRLHDTGRITKQEVDLLDKIRRRPRRPPEVVDNELEVYPDIYELLLSLQRVMSIYDEYAFRGHRDARWRIVPTVFRNNPSSAELSLRVERSCAFLNNMAMLNDYRELANADDRDKFLSLIAVAQHNGLPTHLLEFTADMRTAAFWAAHEGQTGDIGEIVLISRHLLDKHGGIEGSPYGRLIEPAQTSGIGRHGGLFLVDAVPSVYRDPDTTFLERYSFYQDGRPFPAAGGYSWKDLSPETVDLESFARHGSEKPLPSSTLKRQLELFSDHIQQTNYDTGKNGGQVLILGI
jgi:serine/threonine protein kinase